MSEKLSIKQIIVSDLLAHGQKIVSKRDKAGEGDE